VPNDTLSSVCAAAAPDHRALVMAAMRDTKTLADRMKILLISGAT
jgi:hypothetical protein